MYVYVLMCVCVCLSVCDTIVTQFILSKSKEDRGFLFILFAKNQFNYHVYLMWEYYPLFSHC